MQKTYSYMFGCTGSMDCPIDLHGLGSTHFDVLLKKNELKQESLLIIRNMFLDGAKPMVLFAFLINLPSGYC